MNIVPRLLLFAAVCWSAVAVEPISRALPLDVVSNIDTDSIIKLTANVPIPDDGELNWPIHIVEPDLTTVSSVAVELQGLWHEQIDDLKITLSHRELSSVLIDGVGGKRTFGSPRVPKIVDKVAEDYYMNLSPTGEVRGDGTKYTWTDGVHTNVARDQPSLQSTTQFGGSSAKAVDGVRSGFYSVSSVTHNGSPLVFDPQPWWEVEIGYGKPSNVTTVGTIRLWNRVPETNVPEVQVIKMRSSNTIPPTFTFNVSFTHLGVTTVSAPISATNIPSLLDEDALSTEIDSLLSAARVRGSEFFESLAARGQSVQAKLEALPNFGRLYVSRSGPYEHNGYDWSITFLTEIGNVPSMTVNFDASGCDFGPDFTIDTIREGGVNTWVNANPEIIASSGYIFPCWLIVSNSSGADVPSLDAAKSTAIFKRWLAPGTNGVTSVDQRETTVILPFPVVGRYVRIQRQDSLYLSIAEVEVFSEQFTTLSNYRGGSPVISRTFQPEVSVNNVFAGSMIDGMWMLSILDKTGRQLVGGVSGKPRHFEHGSGGLHSWSLILTDNHGNTTRYNSDVMFSVKTLPIMGKLYAFNVTSGGRGQEIPVTPTLEFYTSRCYKNDCGSRYGVGIPLSTSSEGGVAIHTNRITEVDNAFKVVYVPNEKWVGVDKFTYSVFVGVTESTSVPAKLHVRRCRLTCANEIVDDIALPLY